MPLSPVPPPAASWATTIGAGVFGSKHDTAASSAEYMALLSSGSAAAYYVIFLMVMLTLVVLSRRLDANSRESPSPFSEAAPLCGGLGFERGL